MDRIKAARAHDVFCHADAQDRQISPNGPVGTIMQVQSDTYPVEAQMIKHFFLDTSTIHGSSSSNGTTNITIRGGAEDEKDAEATVGWSINLLFDIGATVDFSTGAITNAMLPIPSDSIKNVAEAKTHNLLVSRTKLVPPH